ncbi:unnamed protein product [Sphenostylis stenocarpa]|uniref:UV excision repair protein RAD23 n=1 Tax=Sphenostylis stenocarpa TaxID=92480 RepID=A0AA86V9R0_9FABA|nr:unnamed protein product [Sphenostylis stenocarpa]
MKINVKTLKGTHFVIQVNPQDTVADMKKNIEAAQGANIYPAAQQMLIHQGKVLVDATTLEENKVVEDNFVVIMLGKNKEAQPKSYFPPTSSTSQPPASTVGQGESNSKQIPDITPPPSSVSGIYGHATSNLNTGSNLESTIQQILEMGGGNWDRDTIIRALQAAFNNPERAIEYLYSGIPEEADAAEVARSPMTRQAENSSIQAPQPAIPTSGPNTSPLNLFPHGIPELGTPTDDNIADLDFLRNNRRFQELRAMVRANPELLQPMLQDVGKRNPELLHVIQDHQENLLDLINEPLGDE